MTRDPEDLLRGAPLRAPSAPLAERIDDAFARAGAERVVWFRAPIPLWVCATVALACVGLGYLGRGGPAPTPPRVVHILPLQEELRRVFAGEAEQRPVNSLEAVQVHV